MVKFYSNDDAKKQIAVVDRPDSNATTAPKIPDGALSQSFGLKTRGNISKTSPLPIHMLYYGQGSQHSVK